VLSVTGEGSVVEADPRVAFFDKGAPRGEAAEPDARSRGLYFCRVAIEAHGGSLELVSDPALATFFRIELPA
jgi:sensor histidine kinase regulating citrate/malate metabolism